jgi:hypothetical protein
MAGPLSLCWVLREVFLDDILDLVDPSFLEVVGDLTDG